jgi:hypothetical protein
VPAKVALRKRSLTCRNHDSSRIDITRISLASPLMSVHRVKTFASRAKRLLAIFNRPSYCRLLRRKTSECLCLWQDARRVGPDEIVFSVILRVEGSRNKSARAILPYRAGQSGTVSEDLWPRWTGSVPIDASRSFEITSTCC